MDQDARRVFDIAVRYGSFIFLACEVCDNDKWRERHPNFSEALRATRTFLSHAPREAPVPALYPRISLWNVRAILQHFGIDIEGEREQVKFCVSDFPNYFAFDRLQPIVYTGGKYNIPLDCPEEVSDHISSRKLEELDASESTAKFVDILNSSVARRNDAWARAVQSYRARKFGDDTPPRFQGYYYREELECALKYGLFLFPSVDGFRNDDEWKKNHPSLSKVLRHTRAFLTHHFSGNALTFPVIALVNVVAILHSVGINLWEDRACVKDLLQRERSELPNVERGSALVYTESRVLLTGPDARTEDEVLHNLVTVPANALRAELDGHPKTQLLLRFLQVTVGQRQDHWNETLRMHLYRMAEQQAPISFPTADTPDSAQRARAFSQITHKSEVLAWQRPNFDERLQSCEEQLQLRINQGGGKLSTCDLCFLSAVLNSISTARVQRRLNMDHVAAGAVGKDEVEAADG